MIIAMMSIGLCIALGQVIVHDIIPTFWNGNKHVAHPWGILFGTVFIIDAVIMLWQMWVKLSENRHV